METEQTVQTNTNEYSSICLTKRMLSFLIKRNKNKKMRQREKEKQKEGNQICKNEEPNKKTRNKKD